MYLDHRFNITAQKMKFSFKDFFSKCDQIRRFLRIWTNLLKKYLMENLIFCAVYIEARNTQRITNSSVCNNKRSKIKQIKNTKQQLRATLCKKNSVYLDWTFSS